MKSFKETVSKLVKQVEKQLAKVRNLMELFRQIKRTLNRGKRRIREFICSRNASSRSENDFSLPNIVDVENGDIPLELSGEVIVRTWLESLWIEAVGQEFLPKDNDLEMNEPPLFSDMPKVVKWSWLLRAINEKFTSGLGRGLSEDQQAYLKEFLFRDRDNETEYGKDFMLNDDPSVTWKLFAEDCRTKYLVHNDENDNYTGQIDYSFGDWLYHCYKILLWKPADEKFAELGMKLLWTQGKIVGFIEKSKIWELLEQQAKLMAEKNKRAEPSIFLIRFPENKPGSIGVYVYDSSALPAFYSTWFMLEELNEVALTDRLLKCKYPPEYLYPDIKIADAFRGMTNLQETCQID